MSLTVIVEDGTGVANANSYVTLEAVKAFNAQRGVDLPADDDSIVELMTTAMDYLESYENRWQGSRSLPLLQELSWPRQGVVLYQNYWPIDAIPSKLKQAQCYLVGIATTVDLNAVQDTRAITKEVIGPLETDYSATAGATVRPMMPLFDSMIAPLCNPGAGQLRSVRI